MLSQKPLKLEKVLILILGIIAGCLNVSLFGTLILRHYQQKLDENSIGYLVVGTLGLHGTIIAGVTVFLWWQKITWSETFGFIRRTAGRSIVFGTLGAVAFLPVGFLLQLISLRLLSLLHFKSPDQAAVVTLQGAQSWGAKAYLITFTALVAPVAEELIFRGIIYPTIKQMGYPRVALWATALLFAAIHGNVPIFLPLLVLALALAFLYEVTDNLLAPITAHAVFNGINVTMLYFGDDLSQLWVRLYQNLLHH